MRYIAAAMIAATSIACAHAQNLSDSDLKNLHQICTSPGHMHAEGGGPVSSRSIVYNDDYAQQCKAVDAEISKRGIAAQEKETADKNALDSALKTLSK